MKVSKDCMNIKRADWGVSLGIAFTLNSIVLILSYIVTINLAFLFLG